MQGTPEIEEIMARIRDHIIPGADPKTNMTRYNMVWNAIQKWSKEQPPNKVETPCPCWDNIDIYDIDMWNHCPICGNLLEQVKK